MKRMLSMLTILCLLLALAPAPVWAEDTDTARPDLPECLDSEWEVLRLTNRIRHQIGLDPVTTQDILFKAAGIRAGEITGLYDHVRPDGSDFSTIFFDVNYPWFDSDENIAAGPGTPAAVVSAWMNNDRDRAILLDPEFMHLGVGYAPSADAKGHYWTQLFTLGWECQYTSMELGTEYMEVEQGTALEALPLWAAAYCPYCSGDCYLPILPEYCSGYDPDTPGTYTVTVTCLGMTDTLEIKVLGEEPDPEPVTAYGDVDGDGRINTRDLLVMRKYLLGDEIEVDPTGADLNADGRINTKDLIMLRKVLNGEEIPLGPQS